jgi:two-component system cell cycle response regulator
VPGAPLFEVYRSIKTTMHSDIAVKPRVLIADDSRIVRATLIKHIEGMFEFREALDGEQAWEALLLDPSIRVVITDLTMPKLDGYGLLQRIRASKISRIRNIPVVVVSGSDDQQERDRAKEAGATDLITKGIGTAQLVSRLDVLSQLAATQGEFEKGLETLIRQTNKQVHIPLASPEALEEQAQAMLDNALKQRRNFVLLNVIVHVEQQDNVTSNLPPDEVVKAIGQLLLRTIRQTDRVSQTGQTEFTLATGNIHFDSARNFAQRVCNAIANANLANHDHLSLIASCGLVSLSEYDSLEATHEMSLAELQEIACRRAMLGAAHGICGVIDNEGEIEFPDKVIVADKVTTAQHTPPSPPSSQIVNAPDLATLLQWAKEGQRDKVLEHIEHLSTELKPLVDFVLQAAKD